MTHDEKIGLAIAELQDFMHGTLIFPSYLAIKKALKDYDIEPTIDDVNRIHKILRDEVMTAQKTYNIVGNHSTPDAKRRKEDEQ